MWLVAMWQLGSGCFTRRYCEITENCGTSMCMVQPHATWCNQASQQVGVHLVDITAPSYEAQTFLAAFLRKTKLRNWLHFSVSSLYTWHNLAQPGTTWHNLAQPGTPPDAISPSMSILSLSLQWFVCPRSMAHFAHSLSLEAASCQTSTWVSEQSKRDLGLELKMHHATMPLPAEKQHKYHCHPQMPKSVDQHWRLHPTPRLWGSYAQACHLEVWHSLTMCSRECNRTSH